MSLAREFLGFLPIFLLHISIGMTGCFTTILIHYFEHKFPELVNDYTTLLGTSEDYAQIVIAVFGGFLQQMIGPRRMLILATLPNILSWALIAFLSGNVEALILSRVLAGASIGLMASNVYIADVASTKNIVFFNYTRQIFITTGAIMMYAIMQLIYKVLELDFCYVSAFVVGFPLLALLALLCMKESPVYLERRKRLVKEAGPEVSLVKLNMEKMKFPISSPTVYIPFILISSLISLQHFSGFTYSKRFMIQVLESKTNSTKPLLNISDTPVPLNTDSYYWGMLICGVYLASSLLVARLLRSIRRRFMFFISLLLTSICLTLIGFLMEEKLVSSFLTKDTVIFFKVAFLCLHTFVVQCGLQGLPTQLSDILFPSSCKSIMKGLCKAVTSLTLVIFVSTINTFPIYARFWIMAATLILASPLLFIFVPEIRNIGKSTAKNFILPCQTMFYIVLPKLEVRHKWKDATRKISYMKTVLNLLDKRLEKEETRARCVTYTRFFTFVGEVTDLEEFSTDTKLKRRNESLVSYIGNILPQSSVLHENWKEDRILVGRGPTKFPDDIKTSGGIFLFNDVLIVAKCLLRNWRYVNEISFNMEDLKVTREDNKLFLTSMEKSVNISFTEEEEAETWRRFIEFCKTSFVDIRRTNVVEEEEHLL